MLRLRQCKGRDAKPFAVMCATIEQAQALTHLSTEAVRLLTSAVSPVVLAPRRRDTRITHAVARGNHRLGVMLAYSPIHRLLFQVSDGDHLGPLVMTSGNRSGEPLTYQDEDALSRLRGMCDATLLHDRPINRPVDDTVVIDMGEDEPLPVRRARGYVPEPISLDWIGDEVPDGICVGGELKGTVSILRNGEAIVSQHLGDVKDAQVYERLVRTIDDLCSLFGVRPCWVAHDLNPAYVSTSVARAMAISQGIPLVGIQHHHAHAASVMAEHQLRGPVLALVCDGVGFGTDGGVWGGELLLADLTTFHRVARLSPLRLPGGDATAIDTRRSGLALLYQAMGTAFLKHPACNQLVSDPSERHFLATMIQRNVNCASSSSAGRVFDGVAALLEVCRHNHFEAESAMTLESLAAGIPIDDRCDPMSRLSGSDGEGTIGEIDVSPLILKLCAEQERGQPIAELSALFHDQFAAAWDAAVADAAAHCGIDTIVLSGGVFCNERITRGLMARLSRRGMRVLRHTLVPPNDGGLSLGQAAVAAARLSQSKHSPKPIVARARSKRSYSCNT